MMNTATINHINDPQTLQDVIRRLTGTSREQQQAITELKFLGPEAVPIILKRIQNPQAGDNPDQMAYALTMLGPPVAPPLIAALKTSDERLQGVILSILGRVGSSRDVPFLWVHAFPESRPVALRAAARETIARIEFGDPLQAHRVNDFGVAEQLHALVIQHLRGEVIWDTDDAGMATLWAYDAQSDSPTMHLVRPASASRFVAEWLARDLQELVPSSMDSQVLLTATLLEHEVHRAGWDQPIPQGVGTAHDVALIGGSDLCQRVAALALEHRLLGAAVSSIMALGQNGSVDLLYGTGSQVSVLVEALNDTEPRVQFAAAEAAMLLQPTEVFPHANRVVEIFAKGLTSSSQRETVVIDPNEQRGGRMAGLLDEMGYSSRVAATGQEGFERVAEQGDVVLAVIHLNSIRWELTQTVSNLRADARTAAVPIAIYGPLGLEDRAEVLSDRHPGVFYVHESFDSHELRHQLLPVLAQLTPPDLTPQQLNERKQTSAYWLRQIALAGRVDIFPLSDAESSLANALNDPGVAANAIVAYGSIGRAEVQTRLMEHATAPGIDPSQRQRAALHLAFHLKKFGVLLGPSDLRRLEDAHASEADPGVKSLLSAALGAIPREAGAVAPLLEAFPATSIPGP
jgi:CheY-like chemotaxis protein